VGWLLAYAIWAEMGDVGRFTSSSDAVLFRSRHHRLRLGQQALQGPPVAPVISLAPLGAIRGAMAASCKGSPDHPYYEASKLGAKGDSHTALLSVTRKIVRRSYHVLREHAASMTTAV
jgi:hypothetical protein